MRTFTDTKDRVWEVDVNVFSITQVRSKVDVDLQCVLENDYALMKRLLTDAVLRVNVLYVLCQSQASRMIPPVADEDFGRAFSGEVLTTSAEALVGACADFFGGQGKVILEKIFSLSLEAAKISQQESGTKITAALAKMTAAGLAEKLKERSGDAPELSESTQRPKRNRTPSASS